MKDTFKFPLRDPGMPRATLSPGNPADVPCILVLGARGYSEVSIPINPLGDVVNSLSVDITFKRPNGGDVANRKDVFQGIS